MRKFGFYLIWLSLAVGLTLVSFYYKPTTGAMMAEVRSNVTTISYEKPIRVKNIHVVPGQEIKKGDLLVELIQSKIDLDLQQKTNDIQSIQLELEANQSEYQGKINLLNLETEGKVSRLQSELLEEKTALGIENEQKKKFSEVLNIPESGVDTVRLLKLKSLENEIKQLQIFQSKETIQMRARKINREQLLNSQLDILEQELKVLQNESVSLNKYADSGGVIGNVFAEKDELIPPYGKILSVYELNPTLIVAYLNEREVQKITPGTPVLVESQSRGIKIQGSIKELGSRVTKYPETLNNGSLLRYGQEIFITIPPENDFLNGEKVLVYFE